MAFKRYPLRYVRTFKYQNPESKETEDITFMANGYLFPLFKSLAGVELGKALEDYKKELLKIVNPEVVEVIGKFDAAASADEKFEVVKQNPEALLHALTLAQQAMGVESAGLSLIELLLIITRVCALPESDHAEALAAGLELLPEECFQDPALAFEILGLAVQYDDSAKKNCTFQTRAKQRPPG